MIKRNRETYDCPRVNQRVRLDSVLRRKPGRQDTEARAQADLENCDFAHVCGVRLSDGTLNWPGCEYVARSRQRTT
jgi:hypothetical protein